jgi:hypothetical protein
VPVDSSKVSRDSVRDPTLLLPWPCCTVAAAASTCFLDGLLCAPHLPDTCSCLANAGNCSPYTSPIAADNQTPLLLWVGEPKQQCWVPFGFPSFQISRATKPQIHSGVEHLEFQNIVIASDSTLVDVDADADVDDQSIATSMVWALTLWRACQFYNWAIFQLVLLGF